MYYNYHAKNFSRIRSGELVAVEKSNDKDFAFILLFNSPPFIRPIRHLAVHKYEKFFNSKPFLDFLRRNNKILLFHK